MTNGTIQNLNLISKLLFNTKETVGFEDPSPSNFLQVFKFNGLKVKQFRVEQNGLDVNELKATKDVSGVVVSPHNQTPLSVPLSLEKKRELLDWACQSKKWIVELGMEDILIYDGEFSVPIRSLSGSGDNVIYCDSFTLQFFPGIKIGYLVVPKRLSKAFAGAKLLMDRSSYGPQQECLSQFLSSKYYNRHIRNIRRRFSQNYRFITEEIMNSLSAYGTISPTIGGRHLAFHLIGLNDGIVVNNLKASGVVTRALSSFTHSGTAHYNGLMLGFGTITKMEIHKSIITMKQCFEFLNS